MKHLTAREVISLTENGCIPVDIRPGSDFLSSYYPGSLYFSDTGIIKKVFNKLIVEDKGLVIIVSKKNANKDIFSQLEALGYNLHGYYLYDAIELTKEKVKPDVVVEVDPDEFGMDARFDNKMVIVDVRSYEKYAESHVKNAISFPLSDFDDLVLIADLDEKGSIYLYGNNESDAITAASILKREELHNLRVVNSSWDKIKKEPEIQLKNQSK